jgi:hypothetical protein
MKPRRRRWFIRGGIALFAGVLAIQLMPYGRDHSNPPVTGEPRWDSAATRSLAKQACFDCHSHETVWPAYSSIAPASWLVQYDVDQGRSKLNFSTWPRTAGEAREAAEVVRDGEMPPPAYALLHAHARLTPAERVQLADGFTQTFGGERGTDER